MFLHRWQMCVTTTQPRSSRESCLHFRWTKEKIYESNSTGIFEIGTRLFRSNFRARIRSYKSSISLSMTRRTSRLEAPKVALDSRFARLGFEVSGVSVRTKCTIQWIYPTFSHVCSRFVQPVDSYKNKKSCCRTRGGEVLRTLFETRVVVVEEIKKNIKNSIRTWLGQ